MTERAREKAIEKEQAKNLGLIDPTQSNSISNNNSPMLGREQSGLDSSALDKSNTGSPDLGPSKANSATRRREAKMEAQKPKVRTEKELKVLEELANEETRIYKLYKDYAINDLKRDKKNAIEGIKQIKTESKNWRG